MIHERSLARQAVKGMLVYHPTEALKHLQSAHNLWSTLCGLGLSVFGAQAFRSDDAPTCVYCVGFVRSFDL